MPKTRTEVLAGAVPKAGPFSVRVELSDAELNHLTACIMTTRRWLRGDSTQTADDRRVDEELRQLGEKIFKLYKQAAMTTDGAING